MWKRMRAASITNFKLSALPRTGKEKTVWSGQMISCACFKFWSPSAVCRREPVVSRVMCKKWYAPHSAVSKFLFFRVSTLRGLYHFWDGSLFYSASVCRLLIITIFLPSLQYLFSVFCRRKYGHLPELPWEEFFIIVTAAYCCRINAHGGRIQ